MLIRALLSTALILAAGFYTRETHAEHPAARLAFAQMPYTIASYTARNAPPLPDDVVAQLGAEDHANRFYFKNAEPPIALYAGYYASQRHGDAIHSPQNCLPGAGWQPTYFDRAMVPTSRGRVEVNRVVIEKGLERQAVFYWYQGRGRVVANEFANKGWLMVDATRAGRTDGGLVRLITPINKGRVDAFGRLEQFAVTLLPTLWSHLP